jgi:hypothetical protein
LHRQIELALITVLANSRFNPDPEFGAIAAVGRLEIRANLDLDGIRIGRVALIYSS